MVVHSPMPVIPSLQWMRTRVRTWPFIVATDSLCGRMVGRSRITVSTRVTTGAADVVAWGANDWFMSPR